MPARAVARRCHQVVGVSERATETFDDGLRGRVRVVPNGLPPYDFDRAAAHAEVRAALGCADHAPVAALSGRLSPGKGQLELVEALPNVLTGVPDLQVALLGGEDTHFDAYARRVFDRASELGVLERLNRQGHLQSRDHPDAAVRFVAGCDLLVAPSVRLNRGGWEEGFGLAVAEALAVGTPVVAYANGALPETIGNCGIVVTEGDREGLGQAMVRVLTNRAESERLSECGRLRARSRFRLNDQLARLSSCYAEAASGLAR
jgi:glycosyltransferase involved in cell wall biosynthesis